MLPDVLPSKNALELLETDFVTEPTRRVLLARLAEKEPSSPRFFDAQEFSVLLAVSDTLAALRVVPREFVANAIDGRLAENEGNGWRYDSLPPDGEAYRQCLKDLNEAANQRFQIEFTVLTGEQRKELLKSFQRDDHQRFFEELVSEHAEIFYSHPLAQNEIGYIGFADAHGFRIADFGLRSREVIDAALNNQDGEPIIQDEIQLQNPKAAICNPQSESVDAVIIGTGAGGAPILARLAAAGLKVVALEAGKAFDYREFPTDERAQSKLFWTDERLSAGENPVAFGNNNSGCGVGGSTLHYTAYTPRAQADDFHLFSEFGVGRDWDLPFAEVEKYYDEIEWFMGVSGNSNYPWGTPRARNYPLPPLPLNGAAQLMQRACQNLGIKTSPAANAALSQNYYQAEIGWRRACTNRGFCQAGCSVGAKGSMDTTFLPLAVANGAEIRSECFVTEFEFDSNKQIKSVVYRQNGETKRQLCKNVFLCAGAIETPRLLLINNVANSSGQVGKNFMAHPGVQVWGVFDEEIYPHKGIPGGLISEDTHRPQTKFKADFAGGYLLQSIGVMPVTYVSQLARGEKIFGDELGAWMQNYNHTAGINILGDCLPHENNFMELSEEKDARGLPKPRVYFSNGENEKKMNAHAEKLMREIWAEAGARQTWTFQRNAHVIGTCRMGTEAADSVVNTDGQSFDIANLYICDNSIFPSALSVNPALTIMALALRTADRFLSSPKSKV